MSAPHTPSAKPSYALNHGQQMSIEQDNGGLPFRIGYCNEKYVGADSWGAAERDIDFVAVAHPSTTTILLKRARIPITFYATRTDGVTTTEDNFTMGVSVDSLTLTPAVGWEYTSARILRRF